MEKVGVNIGTLDYLPTSTFIKPLKGISHFGENVGLYQKLLILAILGSVSHICKATTVKFSVKARTYDSLPMPNFVLKIA